MEILYAISIMVIVIFFMKQTGDKIIEDRKENINLGYKNEDYYEIYTIDPEEEYKNIVKKLELEYELSLVNINLAKTMNPDYINPFEDLILKLTENEELQDVIHDIIVQIEDRQPSDKEIENIISIIPMKILSIGLQWDFKDTVFGDELFVWIKENIN